MKYQPPDKNNPSNPLLKVAALTLDKEYLKLEPVSEVRVIATLNFKRSDDLRGRATTKTGDNVTVSFSMALKRASLELLFAFENVDSANDVVKIKHVAHMAPLHARDRIKDESKTKKQYGSNRSAKIGAKAKASIIGIDANAEAGVGLGAGSTTKITRNRSVTRSTSKNNISATFGGNAVHWEINPNPAILAEEGGVWLEGEVFKSIDGKTIDACVAGWKQDKRRGVPVITASVFVSMADLILGDVRFLTDGGEDINLKKMDQSQVPVYGALFGLTGMSDAKERLVRQVLRKHLVSQGMAIEGARLQICKAFT